MTFPFSSTKDLLKNAHVRLWFLRIILVICLFWQHSSLLVPTLLLFFSLELFFFLIIDWEIVVILAVYDGRHYDLMLCLLLSFSLSRLGVGCNV